MKEGLHNIDGLLVLHVHYPDLKEYEKGSNEFRAVRDGDRIITYKGKPYLASKLEEYLYGQKHGNTNGDNRLIQAVDYRLTPV